MEEKKEKKKVYNIDGEEIDFSNYNLQEKITYESANFMRRLCAFFVDILLVISIWYLMSISTFAKIDDYVANLGINPDDFTNKEVLSEFAQLYSKTIVKLFLFFYFAQLMYFTIVPAIIGEGKTIGKWIAGIGVVHSETLNELSPSRLILREFVCRTLLETVLIIPLIVSIIISMFREDSKSLHDILAKSVVIRTDLYDIE